MLLFTSKPAGVIGSSFKTHSFMARSRGRNCPVRYNRRHHMGNRFIRGGKFGVVIKSRILPYAASWVYRGRSRSRMFCGSMRDRCRAPTGAATRLRVRSFLYGEELGSRVTGNIECVRQSLRKIKAYLSKGDAETMNNL